MKKFNLLVAMVACTILLQAQTISTFENLTLPPDSFYDGSDLSGGFNSGNAFFVNDYSTSFSSWSGFVYSNMKDSTTSGIVNQYSAITAGGYDGSNNYAVADEYGNAKVYLTGNASGKLVDGFYITNNTTAYMSMRDGDAFAKKFGGTSGNDPDWFKLQARAWLNGIMKPDSVEFYLADFRFADNTQDYIVRTWQWVSLLSLGNADSIQFFLSSSDVGSFGMNTPAYFCMDNFTTTDVNNITPIVNNGELSVFPNPFSNLLNIQIESAIGKVELSDMSGQLMQVSEAGKSIAFNTADLPKGTYIVKTITQEKVFFNKIVKQ